MPFYKGKFHWPIAQPWCLQLEELERMRNEAALKKAEAAAEAAEKKARQAEKEASRQARLEQVPPPAARRLFLRWMPPPDCPDWDI